MLSCTTFDYSIITLIGEHFPLLHLLSDTLQAAIDLREVSDEYEPLVEGIIDPNLYNDERSKKI